MIGAIQATPPVTLPTPNHESSADGFRRFFTAAMEGQADLARVAHRIESEGGLLGLQVEVFRATQQLELSGRLVQSAVETTRKLLETPV